MRWANKITLTTFAKPEENVEEIKKSVIELVPFDLEKAKIQLQTQNATGFNERTIKIFTIVLVKEAHTNDFLQFFLDKLKEEQKNLLISQAESRLDQEFDFFIRIEKDQWIKEREIWLTDSGHCFHIKISLAVFPRTREKALQLVEKLFLIGNL